MPKVGAVFSVTDTLSPDPCGTPSTGTAPVAPTGTPERSTRSNESTVKAWASSSMRLGLSADARLTADAPTQPSTNERIITAPDHRNTTLKHSSTGVRVREACGIGTDEVLRKNPASAVDHGHSRATSVTTVETGRIGGEGVHLCITGAQSGQAVFTCMQARASGTHIHGKRFSVAWASMHAVHATMTLLVVANAKSCVSRAVNSAACVS